MQTKEVKFKRQKAKYSNEEVRVLIKNKNYETLYDFMEKTIELAIKNKKEIHSEIDDMKQDVFVSFIEKKFDKYTEMEKVPFLGWVYTVCINHVYDEIRKVKAKKRAGLFSHEFDERIYPDVFKTHQTSEDVFLMNDLLKKLDKTQKVILSEKMSGYTIEEIVQRTGYKKGRVHQSLRVIKRQLVAR